MVRSFLMVVFAVGLLGSAALERGSGDAPTYTNNESLVFPSEYRDWNFITSGLGMSYSPRATAGMAPMFDNVFVKRSSMEAFRRTGHWPDGTIFVKEVRASSERGSINRNGHFQDAVMGFDVEVKDSRLSGTWRYYEFGSEAETKPASVAALPKDAGCFACHSKNAAVEQTFVQFYPTLLPIAKSKGTLNASYRAATHSDVRSAP